MKRTASVLSALVLNHLRFKFFICRKQSLLQTKHVKESAHKGVGAHLLYLGGPVISKVKIVSVFWGPNVDPTVQSKIAGFYSTVTQSSYMDWLSEYNTNITATNGKPGTNQSIGRGSFGGTFTITPSASAVSSIGTANVLDDTIIRAELASQMASGKLPQSDDNTLYMVSFPPGLTISLTFGGQTAYSCQEFCAYHNSAQANGANLYYGILPDFNGACSSGCGNSSDLFSNYTAAASHEITEAITDPQVGDVPNDAVDYPMAWYDNSYGEVGDICVGTTASVSTYTVQGEWSNKQNACVSGPNGL